MAEEVGTGYIKIKPEMDSGAKNDLIDAGKNSGQGFGESFKVAAGVLIANAVQAIAQGAVDVFSNAFSNYADYEQLVGGVETLFKESSDAVIKNAEVAYRTAGMSANDYMENVTAFSASLLQGLGGDTEKAAAYADMAIRDMSDNANKMGSDMSMIVMAYQGFAKQNYTMLDNLKLGYGGTKQEMQRLLADASKIAGVEFNIDNYNDVIEAIHVMQQEMSIAGTTSKEAASTISGSISMLQASWQNFLTGIFDENADMGALGEQLFDSIGTVLMNVVPRIGVLVGRVFMEIPYAIREVFDQIPVILAPTLIKVFGEELGEKISDIVFDTSDGIVAAIDDALSMVTSLMETAWPVIQGIVEGAMTAIDAFMTEIWPSISELINTVMGIISEDVKSTWTFVMTVMQTVMGAIKAVVENVWPIISSIVQMAMWAIKSAIEGIKPVVDFMKGVFEGVRRAIEDPMEAAKNAVRSIIEAIKNLFNFKIQWPHIPLPHFSVSGSPNPLDWLSGGLPSISVDWYAKGGIVNGATLIGAGEAGPEMILPQQGEFMEDFAERIAEKMGGGIVIDKMTVVTPDPEDFMNQLTTFAARTRAQYA